MKNLLNLGILIFVTIVIFFAGFTKGKKITHAANFGNYLPSNFTQKTDKIEPPFPDADVYTIGDNIKINGIPTEMYCVQTKNSVRRILKHYLNKWRHDGQDAVSDIHENTGYVAYFHKQQKYLKIITAYRDPESGYTLAYLATSIYDQNAKKRKIDDFVFQPGAEEIFQVEYNDNGRKADTVVLMNNASVFSSINY